MSQDLPSELGELNDAQAKLRSHFARLRRQVIRPATGFLKYDYLVPGGYYQEQWDWDGFFIGLHLAARNPADAIYLKYWALNFIHASNDDGRVPGCISPRGPEGGHRAFQMKPFLAQGAYLAARFLGDFSWISPHYDRIKKIVQRRRETNFDSRYGLFFWDNAMQSGADNNPALTNDPGDPGALLACDFNALQLREYLALEKIADSLGHPHDAAELRQEAQDLTESILRRHWHPSDETFYNLRRDSGAPVMRITYSNFVPLWQGLAPPENGRRMVLRYLWNEQHMLSRFGLRSLSKQDPDYNNANILWPYSNWQGPVWPIANYFYFHALLNYGFRAEAERLARMMRELCLADIEKTGAMHENYHAETGAPLAPSGEQSPRGFMEGGFIGWNLLVENMQEEVETRQNPVVI